MSHRRARVRVLSVSRLAVALTLGSFAAQAAGADLGLKAFVAKFADMASHGAVDSMARVTRFPLRNRVFRQPERISAAGFKREVTLNAFADLAPCLKTTPAKPAQGRSAELGAFAVDCDGNIFYFAQDGGAWVFSGFENVNE